MLHFLYSKKCYVSVGRKVQETNMKIDKILILDYHENDMFASKINVVLFQVPYGCRMFEDSPIPKFFMFLNLIQNK